MNPKTKRAILFILPLAIGGGLIYAMNRKVKKDSKTTNATDPDQAATDTPVNTKPVVVTSEFPLQKGSNNAKVKELQQAIGATPVDGIFGSGTEAKLLSFSGVKVVKDQSQLDAIKKQAIGISGKVRADMLVTKFKAGGVALMCTKNTDMQMVTQDSFGAISYLSKFLALSAGKVYNPDDYKLVGSTKMGNLLVQITRGTLAGMWAVDPNTVTITNYSSSTSTTTSSLPGSGLGIMF